MKKQIIFALIAAMLLGTCGAASAQAERQPALIYLCKDFENQDTGEQPWGFKYEGAEGGTSVVEDGGGKAALIKGKADKQNWLRHPLQYAPVVNDIVFSFKFKASDNAAKYVYMRHGAVEPRATHYLDIPNTCTLLSISDIIKLNGTKVYDNVEPGRWYSVTMQLSVKNRRAEISINGGEKKSETLPEMINICEFDFYAPRADGSDLYIDDVKLYESDTVMSDEDFNADLAKYAASGIMPPEKYEIGRVYQYNKFVFQMLYNKFVAYIGADKFYKNNRFYKMPAVIKEENGIVTVPARAFTDAFGAEVGWDADTSTISISSGGRTMRAAVGSDIYYINGRASKLYSPVTIENGAACMQLEVLTTFFKTTFTRDGNMLYFGEKPELKWDLGPMKTNARGNTMKAELEERIRNFLIYDYPSAAEVLDIYAAYNPENAHPRVIVDNFDYIISGMEKEPQYKKLVESMIKKADNYLNAEELEYTKPDGLRGSFPQRIYDRGMYLSFAYRITGDEKYKECLMKNMRKVAEFPDLNPKHFLDVGNSANGLACAYDWMYGYLTDEEQKVIEDIITEKIFPLVVYGTQDPYFSNEGAWSYNAGNQPLIITNGFIGCALALIDKHPQICAEILSNGLRSISNSLADFAPDGAWVEGISYWQYTCDTLPYIVNNLRAGLGTDFSIMHSPGMMKTASFALGMSNGNRTYALGDDSPQGVFHGWFMFQAKQTNDRALAALRKNNMGIASLIDVVNWVFDTEGAEMADIANDMYFRKMETVTMRTGRDAGDTSVLLHGGGNNDGHGHVDIGTFQFNMLGENWATEVEKENYNLIGYGSYTGGGTNNTYRGYEYYRNKAEGHNTVIAGLGSSRQDQVYTARGDIEKHYFSDTGSYAILNMTQTNELYSCALRGVKLDKISGEIVVQDSFKATVPTEFWWFMHTKADAEISEDGKSAILTLNNKRVWAGIISDGDETFSLLPAAPLEGYVADRPPIESPNEGFRKLAINKKNSDTFNVAVAFKTLLSGENEPAVKPAYQKMENWAFTVKKRAHLESVTVNGEAMANFKPQSYNYALNVITEKSDMPQIEVSAEEGVAVEIINSETIPGVTSVVLREGGEVAGIYNFTITPLNDTTKFINDKQIPIVGYEVTSEPQAENKALNLFDGNFETKFATDEIGGAVTIDFGEVKTVHSVMMAFLNGVKRTENFKIEYSENGTDYTEAFSGTNSGTTTELEEYNLGAVGARYLRVSFYGNNGGSNWVSVTEMCAVEE